MMVMVMVMVLALVMGVIVVWSRIMPTRERIGRCSGQRSLAHLGFLQWSSPSIS